MVNVGDNADATGFAGEFDGGFDFGEHRAGFETAFVNVFGEVFGFNFVDGFGARCAEINIGIRNSSNGDKNVGFDFFGEAFGGKIFVDNGVDAFESLQDFSAIDGNTTAAGGDNNDAIFN